VFTIKEQIEKAISEFWEEIILEELALPEDAEKYIDTLDSVTAVDVLVRLEKIVEINLEPFKVIRRGGYESREQFMADLTAKVLAEYETSMMEMAA
jgi:acyl carrier protein